MPAPMSAHCGRGPNRIEDGSWSITGQKVYISWGESDLTENIIHLVLARTPGRPGGNGRPQPVPRSEGGAGQLHPKRGTGTFT